MDDCKVFIIVLSSSTQVQPRSILKKTKTMLALEVKQEPTTLLQKEQYCQKLNSICLFYKFPLGISIPIDSIVLDAIKSTKYCIDPKILIIAESPLLFPSLHVFHKLEILHNTRLTLCTKTVTDKVIENAFENAVNDEYYSKIAYM